ncbi:MAG: hypothetical protein OEX77_04230 [Candidatus Bathyarchaeota archaeon]|nr:hypothetical protein [Candidatus Bathyarchaeota archaeon]MDH5732603.1 hypothetical protein [Candidatus Bathyarchaeota archaeon]
MLEIPWLFVLLIMALCGFTVFLFLPSILELKRPRNHGPRRILKDEIKGIDETVIGSRRLELPFFVKGYIPENLQQTIMSLDGKKISKIDADTTKIVGNMKFPSGIEILENIVIEGHLTIGDESRFHGSVQASENVKIGCNVIVEKDLVSGKDISVDKNTVINGSLNAKGSVQLGPNALVRLSLFSGRNVELGQGAKVTKNIISGGFIVSHENLKP